MSEEFEVTIDQVKKALICCDKGTFTEDQLFNLYLKIHKKNIPEYIYNTFHDLKSFSLELPRKKRNKIKFFMDSYERTIIEYVELKIELMKKEAIINELSNNKKK